ncbi:hypothetical protein CRUP_002320 [Coryphaenoides rupestris]|nr:hypothetical protein CRUP_002320 [Coryphaenoides rupestris]
MLDVSAFLGIATTYVRYKQVQALLGQEEKTLHKTNQLGLVLGTISSSGMCVVANFQKTTLFAMHIVGAVMTFGIGALYIVVQSLLSFHMQPHLHSKTIFSIRLSIAVWTIASIISMFVSSVVMYSSLPGVDVAQKLHWSPGEMGYTAHIISTISEWSLAFSFISFFFTYIRDFQKINLRAETELQNHHLYDSLHDARSANQSEASALLTGNI